MTELWGYIRGLGQKNMEERKEKNKKVKTPEQLVDELIKQVGNPTFWEDRWNRQRYNNLVKSWAERLRNGR